MMNRTQLSVTSVESCIELEFPVVLRSVDQSISNISLDESFFSDDSGCNVSLASPALCPYRSEVLL